MAIFYTDSASFDNITVTQNLTVLGTSSATYTNNLVVESNTIKLGNNQILRYAGVEFVDSGSSPITSASLLFDSTNNQIIYNHNGGLTSSVFLLGPETYNNLGNETYLTQNRLVKGTGIEHLADSNITDTGTLVSIVGPLSASGGITGSGFFGTASRAVTASYAETASFATTASAATSITFVPATASFATTSSFAVSASWAPGGQQGGAFPYDGTVTPAIISGSLIISGSEETKPLVISGSVDSYTSMEIRNFNVGNNASSDFVSAADDATENGNYIDLGINSSTYNAGFVGAAGDGYLYMTSSVGELHIGHAATTANSNIRLFTGGTNSDANTRLFISSSGRVGIKTTVPIADFHVSGSIHSLSQTLMSSGSITAAGSLTVDLNMLSANYFYVSASAAGTVTWTASNIIVAPNVQAFILEYTGGGQKTNSWFANTRWPGGTAPTLSTTGIDLLGFITDDAGSNWRGALLQRNSS